MVSLIPYINMPNAKRAIELYQKLFKAKVISQQPYTKEMAKPGQFPEDFDYSNSLLHAELEIFGQKIHLSDSQNNLSPMGMVDILIDCDSEQQIQKIFNKAKELGSKINLELTKTFWNAYYANFKDPLGINWQLNYQIPVTSGKTQQKGGTKTKKPVKKAMSKNKKTTKKETSKKGTSRKTTKK